MKIVMILVAALIASVSLEAREVSSDTAQQNEEMLYTAVQVVTSKGSGSGVVLHSSECPDNAANICTYAATAYHVIAPTIGAETDVDKQISVEWLDYEKNHSATIVGEHRQFASVVGYDETTDIAILQLSNKKLKMAYLPYLADEGGEIFVNEPTWTVGAPKGYPLTLTNGNVASTHETPTDTGYRFIRTTTDMAGGNSGGGVYIYNSDSGHFELIGIMKGMPQQLAEVYNRGPYPVNVAVVTPINYMGWVVPIERVNALLRKTDKLRYLLEKKEESDNVVAEK